MDKGITFVICALFEAYIIASSRGCKLCDFDKKFLHVRPTCYRWSNVSDSSSVDGIPPTQEDMMMPTATTETTSEETTHVMDCFELIGNKTIQIKSGLFIANDNCTGKLTCINRELTPGEYSCSSNAVCDIRNDERRCYCDSGYKGDGEICSNMTDCLDIFNAGHTTSGVYLIQPSNWNGSPFEVFCEMESSGGWTVFQRRVDGSVDFYRNWTSYKEGFGDLDHEFWLGNEKLHYLTNQDNYKLFIDLVTKDRPKYFAFYDRFRISDENDNYRLIQLGEFLEGSVARDCMADHRNDLFSTFDRDNDEISDNCAILFHGAWWYGNCTECNLNGDYNAAEDSESSVTWRIAPGFSPFFSNLKHVEMKIYRVL